MKQTSEPIVFFGNERLATGVRTTAPTLRKLLDAGYNIVAVVANYEEALSRNKRALEIAAVASEHNIPVLLPKTLRDIKAELEAFKPIAAILVAYGKMVPQSIIDIFPRGIINIHPSLLPQHRGPTPLESVILDGSRETGVSLMQLTKAMDAGPVFIQKKVPLHGDEDKQLLADQLLDLGGNMLVEHLPAVLVGSLQPAPQDDSRATYDDLLTRDASRINWAKPAEQLEREIRAFLEWPKSRTTLGAIDLVITKAHVIDASGTPGTSTIIEKQLVVHCGGHALAIDRLKPAGKQEMTGEAFLAGYKSQIGL